MRTPTKHDIELLQKYGIKYLYHMTSVKNVDSILRHGLLSHNEAHRRHLVKKDISMQGVQSLRGNKIVSSHTLHDYVCLYFSPRNPMLYVRQDIQAEIVMICISPDVLVFEETRISDGNAADKDTEFYLGYESLQHLPWHIIKSRYWPDHEDGKRRKCAEVLVYPRIPASLIRKIYCCNQRTRISCVNMVNQKIPVEINYSLYF